MKIDLSKIGTLCLPYMKRPKRILGAKVVIVNNIENNAGDKFESGEIAEIWQSFRGYGLKVKGEDGRVRYITRVSHYDVRFLKEGVNLF